VFSIFGVLCSEVSFTKVVGRDFVELGCQNVEMGEGRDDAFGSARSAKQVDQDDMFLRNLVVDKHVDSLADFVSCSHDGVEEEDFPLGNVRGELGEDDSGLVSLRVRVDEDLADPHGAAAVLERLLHGLARPHDRDAAVALLVAQPLVGLAGGRGHLRFRVRQLVQTLLDDGPYQPVGDESEIRAGSLNVANLRLKLPNLVGTGDDPEVISKI